MASGVAGYMDVDESMRSRQLLMAYVATALDLRHHAIVNDKWLTTGPVSASKSDITPSCLVVLVVVLLDNPRLGRRAFPNSKVNFYYLIGLPNLTSFSKAWNIESYNMHRKLIETSTAFIEHIDPDFLWIDDGGE